MMVSAGRVQRRVLFGAQGLRGFYWKDTGRVPFCPALGISRLALLVCFPETRTGFRETDQERQ